ncbi:sn1-specific diacylglycerol lipase beta-like isoform X2 [Actinia tenebrosa]|uniref:sn-1-specific diacylglycerol lipase n=1 Tax=Actinia tenebrosa TaxID=6105 RepID=A0A6P8IM02_ACTTE|nr:sn1-specific diacylglycerol lipase beta-like isoform X2 [Actinia tenebrosa]
MPALVAFNRRWQIGSDDLVFVFAGGLMARIAWVTVLCIIFGVYHSQIRLCTASFALQSFFIGVIALTFIVILNEIAIIWMSMRGSVINTRPRRHIPILLYIQIALYVPETCLSALGIYWAFYESKGCEDGLTIPVKITVVLQWCLFLTVLVVVVVFFDPLGSTQITDHGEDRRALQEKTTKIWERRCKVLCCCFASCDEDYRDAISDIAGMFASELHGIDAVPSDVAAGLILLQEQQEEEERQKIQDGQTSSEGVPVDLSDPSQKKLIDDAAHFMKYSLGSYGWPMYVFMNPCCGTFHFCSKVRWLSCLGPRAKHIINDNCCMCNSAAIHLQSSLPESDLIYCTYHNKLYEIPFYVAIDDKAKAVVISIRGTLSMRDTLTDLTGHGERIDMEGVEDGMAHKGMFLSAQYIKKVLLDNGILQGAFDEAEDRGGNYRLVIVGHSLGAGTASVLSILLKPLFPGLQCFAYSNPSVLNESATVNCEDYVLSVLVGKDVVPRMSVKTLNTLVQDLENVIMNCNLPKYRILMTGCWRAICFFLGNNNKNRKGKRGERQPLSSSTGGARSSYVSNNGGSSESESNRQRNESQLVRLFPAGKILQIDVKPKNRPRPGLAYDLTWANKENYDRVIICPTMVKDHFPDVVMNALRDITS